jgi:hypothetical protein
MFSLLNLFSGSSKRRDGNAYLGAVEFYILPSRVWKHRRKNEIVIKRKAEA